MILHRHKWFAIGYATFRCLDPKCWKVGTQNQTNLKIRVSKILH